MKRTALQPQWWCFPEQTCVGFRRTLYFTSSSCVFLILYPFFLFVSLVYVYIVLHCTPEFRSVNSFLWSPRLLPCLCCQHPLMFGFSASRRHHTPVAKHFLHFMSFTSLSSDLSKFTLPGLTRIALLVKTSFLARCINSWTPVPLQYSISVNDLSLGPTIISKHSIPTVGLIFTSYIASQEEKKENFKHVTLWIFEVMMKSPLNSSLVSQKSDFFCSSFE